MAARTLLVGCKKAEPNSGKTLSTCARRYLLECSNFNLNLATIIFSRLSHLLGFISNVAPTCCRSCHKTEF